MNAIQFQNNSLSTINEASECYETPVFRGTQIVRDGTKKIQRLKLDELTAMSLGTQNVGLFVESCPSFERMVHHFRLLGNAPDSTWVIVASSEKVQGELQQAFDSEYFYDCDENPQNVLIKTPEELSNMSDELQNVAGILVFDYACHIHKARGTKNKSRFGRNDRPQMIVDFRSRHRVGEWSPPMLFFTSRRALAVNTQPMLSPYCLEAFRYIDGATMKFGKVEPIVRQSSIAV